MPTLQLTTTTPYLLHPGGSSNSVVIANQDTTNPVIVGSELGLYAAQAGGSGGLLTDPNITEIVPGQSYTFDGSRDIYGLAVTGNPTVNIAENVTNTNTALAGTNLVTPTTILNFAKNNIVVGGSGTKILGPVMLNQPSYEIQFQLGAAATATVPFMDIIMTWSDSITNLVVAQEEWVLAGGPALNTSNVYAIKGPTKGNQILITFNNLDPAQSIQAIFKMGVNSRNLNRDKIYTLAFQAPNGYVTTGQAGFTDVIATVNSMNVNAGTSQSRLFPPYAGDVWFWVDQQGNAAGNSNFQLQVTPTSFFGTAPFFGAGPSGGTPSGQGTVMRWPRGHVFLTYNNTGSVSSTVNIKAIALDENN